jgi:recombinational DNA repair protein (RecF pathway)
MAYQTYITEALVCDSIDSQTSDRSYLLFTREAGMLYASARSVREERSKQRYALQICSHVRVTLVHGKSGWKIVGAEPLHNLYNEMHTREGRAFLRNVILLLRRVIHGDTSHHDIFEDVVTAIFLVARSSSNSIELILSLRILSRLGYVAPHELYSHLLDAPLHTLTQHNLDEKTLVKCRETITQGLSLSHL